MQLLFEYLALLREGPQRWVWDEMAAMGEMRFRFQEEEETAEYVASIASDLHHYPPEDVLIQPNLYAEFDPDLVSSWCWSCCCCCFDGCCECSGCKVV